MAKLHSYGLTDATAVGEEGPEVVDVPAGSQATPAVEPEPDSEPEVDDEDTPDEGDEGSPEVTDTDNAPGDDGDGGGDGADPAVLVRPAGNASTETWLDYALAIGVELDGPADEQTRADLIAAVDAHLAAES